MHHNILSYNTDYYHISQYATIKYTLFIIRIFIYNHNKVIWEQSSYFFGLSHTNSNQYNNITPSFHASHVFHHYLIFVSSKGIILFLFSLS